MPDEVKTQVFTDMVVSQAVLLDAKESDDGVMRARWRATTTNILNDNNRVYPDPVMDAALQESNQSVKENRMVGESPHPPHYTGVNGKVVFDTKLENNVIKIYNQFKENGEVFIDAEVLDTHKGRDLKALIKAGVPVGISMRALGESVKRKVNGVIADVATRLQIISWDVVMNPATAGSEVVAVLTDSQVAELMQDDVQITIPNCPKCGNKLTPQDPDNDNDLDFYSCEPCKEVYIPDESKTVAYRAEQVLRTLPNDPDYDGWSLARDYKRKMTGGTGYTDSTEKGDEEMPEIKEILDAMESNPQFQAMIDKIAEAKAQTIAKPVLDHIDAQKQAEEAAKVIADNKAEAKAFVDGKLAEMKDKLHPKAHELIADKLKDAPNKDVASMMLDSLVGIYSEASSKAILDGMGFDANNIPAGGHTRAEVTHEHKPWEKHSRQMLDALDREMVARGETIRKSIRDVNKPIVDKLIAHAEKNAVLYDGSGNVAKTGYEAMKDSAAFLDSVMSDSGGAITTAQMLNQPTISQILLVQAFQDIESMQFLGMDTFDGEEIRYMTEIYNSASKINPDTGLLDILSGENEEIAESSVQTNWQSYNPSWRRNAVSVTTEASRNMITGPAKYDPLARGIYHIAYDKRRIMDDLAYLEMFMNSEEYAPLKVVDETPTAGALTAVSNSTNVKFSYNVTNGGQAPDTAGQNPIVRPRKKVVFNYDGTRQTIQVNQLTAVVGSTTLTRGYLDKETGNIQNGDYAVDWENGVLYFAASAGLDPAAATPILPKLTYSAATNFDRWSLTKAAGYTKDEEWYNTLITQFTTSAALMGSAPRFKRPNVGIMSMNTAARIQNATMWYRLNDPSNSTLNGMATSTIFGSRSDVNFAQINAPWVCGDSRILLTQKGSTKYAVQTPYQIEGPFPKYGPNGLLIDAKAFMARENSLFCTPQAMDAQYNALNPVSRTIKIVL